MTKTLPSDIHLVPFTLDPFNNDELPLATRFFAVDRYGKFIGMTAEWQPDFFDKNSRPNLPKSAIIIHYITKDNRPIYELVRFNTFCMEASTVLKKIKRRMALIKNQNLLSSHVGPLQ